MNAVPLSQVLEAKRKPPEPKPPKKPTRAAAHTAQAAAQASAEKDAKTRAKENAEEKKKVAKKVEREQKKAVERKQREVKKDVKANHARRRKTQQARAAEKEAKKGPDKEGTRGPHSEFQKNKAKVDRVPAQLAHCMLAIRFKRKKSTRAAWNICRWSLTKHGYLKPPYNEGGKLDKVKQTQKGSRRSMAHAMEKKPLGGGIKGTGANKYMKFQRMFKAISKTV